MFSDEIPNLAIRLKPHGLYYETHTDNLQELLNMHNHSTSMLYIDSTLAISVVG